MKNLLLLCLLCISFGSFGQIYSTIEAPIGFLRNEPKVTATIIFRLEEKARVRIIEKLNQTWSKVEYKYDSILLIGYITNHTLEHSNILREEAPGISHN